MTDKLAKKAAMRVAVAEELARLAIDGYGPTVDMWTSGRSLHICSVDTAKRLFGCSWGSILQLHGLKTRRMGDNAAAPALERLTPDERLDQRGNSERNAMLDGEIKAIAAELHRLSRDGFGPTVHQWNAERQPGMPHSSTLRYRYGGIRWVEILDRHGLDAEEYRHKPWSAKTTSAAGRALQHAIANGAQPVTAADRYPNGITGILRKEEVVVGRTSDGRTVLVARQTIELR